MTGPVKGPVPVTLLTGFLGSGKTTLLNRLLDIGALADAALVINEFGDVGIDHLLVEQADEGIVELSDGCLCCTIRGDLVDTFVGLLDRQPPPARIVVETTGLADPAPVLHAVMGHPVLSEQLHLDGVIAVVDAVNGMATLDAHEEAVKQIAVADRLVITKTDVAGHAGDLRTRLEQLNPNARQLDNKPLAEDLFGCGLHNPGTGRIDVEGWLGDAALATREHDHDHDGHDGHHHHDVNRHDARIRAFTLKTDQAIDAAALAAFVDLLRSAHGPNLLRFKAIVKLADDPDRPVVLHGVQQVFHPPATLSRWPDTAKQTRMVLITRDLSEDFVTRLFDAFTGKPATDTPDRTALENNPLSVPGVSG